MRNALIVALGLALLAGCETFNGGADTPWGGVTRTFDIPIARVKPAFVTTLTQMGMPISAIEVRGKNDVVKSKKADKSVEIEFERLGASSTRVRVTGSDQAVILRETEKRLGGS